MIRRSTRLPKQPPKSLAEDAFDPKDEPGVADEDDDLPLPKKTRCKKRKANGETTDCQPQPKKVRGTRGILKQLVEMPLDVLFEIFGRLEPLDLLHLARTTKDLRAFLMSHSSISIWKESRSNVAGLPECPEDLSEPQYANLAFGKGCDYCLRNLGIIHTVWSARLKICTKCVDYQFKRQGNDWNSDRGYPFELANMVPVIIRGHDSRDEKIFYYAELDEQWRKKYKNAKNKRKWLQGLVEERKIISEHADACSKWYERIQTAREQQRASAINDRKALVVKRLHKLGWKQELSKMSQGCTKPQDHPTVLKACQKELTERALTNLEDFLNFFMQTVKNARLAKDRRNMLRQRLPVLNDVLETHISTLPANALHPSVGELFRIPPVWAIIANTALAVDFKKDHLDPIVPMFPDLTLRWQKKIEDKLLDLVKTAYPEYTFDPETVFQLATTSFSCSRCCRYEGEALWHPRVLMHSCAIKKDFSPVTDIDMQDLVHAVGQLYWNTRSLINFKPFNMQLLTQVVEMCGFDPKTTTAVEMDLVNPIIECLTCNRSHEGRATMTWRRVCAHIKEHSSGTLSKMKLEVMNDQDAEIVRARMAEQQERTRASPHYSGMICVHCKQTGNSTNLMKHVKKDHGKLNPTNEDIQPLLDSNHVPQVFHLWPPREEVEEELPARTGI